MEFRKVENLIDFDLTITGKHKFVSSCKLFEIRSCYRLQKKNIKGIKLCFCLFAILVNNYPTQENHTCRGNVRVGILKFKIIV